MDDDELNEKGAASASTKPMTQVRNHVFLWNQAVGFFLRIIHIVLDLMFIINSNCNCQFIFKSI